MKNSFVMPRMCCNNVNGYLNQIPRAKARSPPPQGRWGLVHISRRRRLNLGKTASSLLLSRLVKWRFFLRLQFSEGAHPAKLWPFSGDSEDDQ